jgi:hypothetical protein
MTNFSLIPFALNTAPAIEITGFIERQNNRLAIEYRLERLSQIVIPRNNATPTRQHDLWEHTCFEFFLGLKNSTKYWEFNLSPTKHWNVFYFPNYRQDVAEEIAFDILPFQVLLKNDSLLLNLEVNLDRIISSKSDLEVGITTVVEDQKRLLSYWALTHRTKEADFHHRDSFTIKL